MTAPDIDLLAAARASSRTVAAIPRTPATEVNLAPGRARARRRRARSRSTGMTPIEIADRIAGCLAWFDGTCPRCDEPIVSRESQIVKRREDWIHTSCAPGACDEW